MLLSDICEIIMGQSPSSDSYNVKEQGLPFFQGNADFGKLYPSVRLWCNCPIKKAEAGDLLVSVRAPIGAVNLANQKCCIGRGLAALRPYRDKCDALYLYYLIKAGKNKLNWLGTGSTFKAITRNSLLSFNIPDYCIAIQKKISGKLWSVDKLIHQRNEQLKLFELLIQSRFIEMFSVDKGWPLVKLDTLCDSIVRGPFGSALKVSFFVEKGPDAVKVYEQKNAIQRSAKLGESYVTQDKYQELKRFSCGPGDFIMSCSGTIGCLYQIPEGAESGIINQALCKFHLNGKMLPEVFLTYMRNSVDQLETKGSGIKNIGAVSYIKNMEIALPPIEVQQQFAEFINQSDKSKMAVQKSLDELETLKKSLMQTYFG